MVFLAGEVHSAQAPAEFRPGCVSSLTATRLGCLVEIFALLESPKQRRVRHAHPSETTFCIQIKSSLCRLGRFLVKTTKRFFRWRAGRGFVAAFYRHHSGIDHRLWLGADRARRLSTATAASALAFGLAFCRAASRPAPRTSHRAASTTSASPALSRWRPLFFLMANAITGSQGYFQLVQFVPLFFGTLIVGNRQQRLHAATGRGCLLFSHGCIIQETAVKRARALSAAK